MQNGFLLILKEETPFETENISVTDISMFSDLCQRTLSEHATLLE